MANESRMPSPPRRLNVALWAGLLLAPIAWAVHLQLDYALVPLVRAGRLTTRALHLSSLLFLVAAAVGAWIAWRAWRREDRQWPSSEDEGVIARTRFLGALGVITSIFFFVVILAQSLPSFFIQPWHE